MGKAMELIGALAIQPNTGLAFAPLTGNSLTVRDTRRPVWLGPVWQSRQVAGFLRITSPLMHDAVVGIQMQAPIGQTVTLWQPSLQPLYPQDTIVIFGSGSNVALDIEQAFTLFHYEDLPGVDAYLIDEPELMRRAEDIYSWTNTISTTSILGQYSGSETLVAEQDQLKANTDYAIIGYTATVNAGAVRYTGSDWGNLGVGGPVCVGGTDGAMQTRDWFLQLSRIMRMSCIPCFNASNKSLTFLDVATDENAGDPVITTIAVRLSPKGSGKRQ